MLNGPKDLSNIKVLVGHYLTDWNGILPDMNFQNLIILAKHQHFPYKYSTCMERGYIIKYNKENIFCFILSSS